MSTTTIAAPRVRRRRRTPWLLILFTVGPAAVLYLGFVLAPLTQSVVYSLFSWTGFGPLDNFVGLNNYVETITDTVFQRGLLDNVVVILFSIIVELPLALWVASLLHGNFRGRGFFRVIFLVPYIISEVVAGVVWVILLNPDGVINEMFRSVGLGFLAHSWLADPATVLPTLLVIITWKYFGFYTLLYLAALQAVPDEIIEAARVDGANRWQIFRSITLPFLGPTTRIAIFLSTVGALQLFDLVWVMTKGGPVNASSTVVTYLISNGISSYRIGYASAVSVIVALIAFAFAALYQRFVLSRDNVDQGSTR